MSWEERQRATWRELQTSPHTHTQKKIKDIYSKKKYRRKVLLSFPLALVFAEDQLLNVLFSRTWLDLRGPLIAEQHRPKEQRSTILKRQARWKGTEVWVGLCWTRNNPPNIENELWFLQNCVFCTIEESFYKHPGRVLERSRVVMPVNSFCISIRCLPAETLQ